MDRLSGGNDIRKTIRLETRPRTSGIPKHNLTILLAGRDKKLRMGGVPRDVIYIVRMCTRVHTCSPNLHLMYIYTLEPHEPRGERGRRHGKRDTRSFRVAKP